MLTGCASGVPELIERTTLEIEDDGEITSYLVDSFDKAYYEVSELKAMAVEDAAAYNTEHQEGDVVPITVEEVELLEQGNLVRVTYQYADAEVYQEHMEGVLFYGTVAEALANGYDMQSISMHKAKDGTPEAIDWIEEATKRHILITDQKADIYCPYKVSHISEGAVMKDDGGVDATMSEAMVYILMNK